VAKSVFILLFAMIADSAFACSCRQDMTDEDRIRSSEHIYLGRVVDISPVLEAPVHGNYTEFEVNIEVVETWKGTEASAVRASMNEIYNDPSESTRAISSCSAPLPLGFRGFVVLLTSDVKPAFSTCIHNVWLIDEKVVDETRGFVSSEMD